MTSVAQMRTDMEKLLDAELRKLRAEADAATAQSKQMVADELINVRSEVQKRIDNEFKSENINATVRDAAQRMVQGEVRRLIDEEVAKQVASVVAEQRVGIDAAARLANLVQGARDLWEPNRRSFDELVRIANSHNAASPSAKEAVDQIVQTWDASFKDPKFGTPQGPSPTSSPEEFDRLIKTAKNPIERRIALTRYVPEPDSAKRAIPTLMKIFLDDSDLSTAAIALFKFNQIEHTSFRVGDWTEANEFWTSRNR